MDLEKLVTRSLDLVNVVAKQDRDPFVALLVELIEEKRPEGPEQVEALVREAVECFEMERDDLAERVLEMLPVSDITTGFLQEKPIMEGDRCVVALEETGWHKGTVLRIFGEKDKRRFVCVLDDYGGEHSVSRSELAMEWETSDLGVRGKDDEDGVCPMCERTSLLTAHHLRPRQMHARLIKKFTREGQSLFSCLLSLTFLSKS